MSAIDDYLSKEELDATESLAEELFTKRKKVRAKTKQKAKEESYTEQKTPMPAAKGKVPKEIATALEEYVSLIEAQIMDIAEVVAQNTKKMEELRNRRDIVKEYIRTNSNE